MCNRTANQPLQLPSQVSPHPGGELYFANKAVPVQTSQGADFRHRSGQPTEEDAAGTQDSSLAAEPPATTVCLS